MRTVSKSIPLVAATLLAIAAILLTIACGQPAETNGTADTPDSPPPAASEGTAISAAGLQLSLPSGWMQEQPSSQMRAAQASIPGSAGPGQMAIFFFGEGGGGGVDANINRWIGQMEIAEGTEPARETHQGNGTTITTVDAGGTLKASRIGSFPATDMPDYRMLAAVIEGAGGPWFIRAVGPEATMAEQRDAFFAMVQSASP